MTKQLEALIARLKGRYGPTEVPKCRICSGKLSLQRSGTGGDVWACSGQIDDEDGWQYAPGRSIADTHYQESRWHDYSGGGDADVIELIAALEQAEKQRESWRQIAQTNISEREKDIAALDAARSRIAELEAKLETADKLQDSAFRHGLQHGFSYGQTNDQSGFEQAMKAYSNIRAAGGTVEEKRA